MKYSDVELGVANMNLSTRGEVKAATDAKARFSTSDGNIGLIEPTFAEHITQLEAWRAGTPNAAQQALIDRYDEYKAEWLALRATVQSVVAGLAGVEF